MMLRLFLAILLTIGCVGNVRKISHKYKDIQLDTFAWDTLKGSEAWRDKLFFMYREQEIQSIVLHTTQTKTLPKYMEDSVLSGFRIHLGIDKNGKLYGDKNPFLIVTRAVPKMDSVAIHISLEGTESEILSNALQLKTAEDLLKLLTEKAEIPKTNQNINSKAGIFTHTQAKKKYGNFVELTECGGEKLLQKLLSQINGKYVPEEHWEGRYERDWVSRRERNIPGKTIQPFDRGRGITIAPKLELEALEKTQEGNTPEAFRLQYAFKQKINPICVVLHFTAIPSFKRSQEVLESRGLSATIMVDKDAKAYQLVDYLEDMAQAATGTNQDCIQIEIVGRNTDELQANLPQTKKVQELVLELSKKYNIPLTNEKIEDLKGIFSHTQAKKKFGGSVALIGKDFDPGEAYMKIILDAVGGKFHEEKDWFQRSSEDWIMLFADFQP